MVSPRFIYRLQSRSIGDDSIKLGVGLCASDNDEDPVLINIEGEVTVDLASNGLNGLDAGSPAADTFYYLFAIKNTDTGAEGSLVSSSKDSPTLPSGFSAKRLVGAFRTDDVGAILAFVISGLHHIKTHMYVCDLYTKCLVLINGTEEDWTDVSCASRIPPSIEKGIFCLCNYEGSTAPVYMREDGSDGDGMSSFIPDVCCHRKFSLGCPSQVVEYQVDPGGIAFMAVAGFELDLIAL